MHERLVFELLGIRERFSNSSTRKALDAYQNHRPQPQGGQDKAPMHKAPLRYAAHPLSVCSSILKELRPLCPELACQPHDHHCGAQDI